MKKIYVVMNVRPECQVFDSFEAMKEFTMTKAIKRKCPCTIHIEKLDGSYEWMGTDRYGESHIYVYEREI